MNALQITLPKRICVLKFGATWCGPCQKIIPLITSLGDQYPNITIINVDADEEPEKCKSFGVTKLPTLVFVYNTNYKSVIGTDDVQIKYEFESLNKFATNQNLDQHTVGTNINK
jgi:thioredoxin 1